MIATLVYINHKILKRKPAATKTWRSFHDAWPASKAILLSQNQFLELNWHILTFLHSIFLCWWITYLAPLEMFLQSQGLRIEGEERERERERERGRVVCVTLEKKKRKKRVKYASCKSDLAEFHGDGSWIASCKA